MKGREVGYFLFFFCRVIWKGGGGLNIVLTLKIKLGTSWSKNMHTKFGAKIMIVI